MADEQTNERPLLYLRHGMLLARCASDAGMSSGPRWPRKLRFTPAGGEAIAIGNTGTRRSTAQERRLAKKCQVPCVQTLQGMWPLTSIVVSGFSLPVTHFACSNVCRNGQPSRPLNHPFSGPLCLFLTAAFHAPPADYRFGAVANRSASARRAAVDYASNAIYAHAAPQRLLNLGHVRSAIFCSGCDSTAASQCWRNRFETIEGAAHRLSCDARILDPHESRPARQ